MNLLVTIVVSTTRLEKLMNALGEDGLDEFDLAQLRSVSGPPADEEGSDEEEEDTMMARKMVQTQKVCHKKRSQERGGDGGSR